MFLHSNDVNDANTQKTNQQFKISLKLDQNYCHQNTSNGVNEHDGKSENHIT